MSLNKNKYVSLYFKLTKSVMLFSHGVLQRFTKIGMDPETVRSFHFLTFCRCMDTDMLFVYCYFMNKRDVFREVLFSRRLSTENKGTIIVYIFY